jgi:hypothetical protein
LGGASQKNKNVNIQSAPHHELSGIPFIRYIQGQNNDVAIKCSAHDALLKSSSSSTLKAKRLRSQIFFFKSLRARKPKGLIKKAKVWLMSPMAYVTYGLCHLWLISPMVYVTYGLCHLWLISPMHEGRKP